MKNTIKVFVLVALTLAAMSFSAQVKLGHIETQKLIQAMPEWTAAQKTFEEEQKKVNTELNGLREQFQTKLGYAGYNRRRIARIAAKNPTFSGNGYGSTGKNTK